MRSVLGPGSCTRGGGTPPPKVVLHKGWGGTPPRRSAQRFLEPHFRGSQNTLCFLDPLLGVAYFLCVLSLVGSNSAPLESLFGVAPVGVHGSVGKAQTTSLEITPPLKGGTFRPPLPPAHVHGEPRKWGSRNLCADLLGGVPPHCRTTLGGFPPPLVQDPGPGTDLTR